MSPAGHVGHPGVVAELGELFAELVANDTNAASLYLRVAAHLLACGPCAEDLAGPLAAVRENLEPGRPCLPGPG